MTPFAEAVRKLRARKGVTQKEMAAALNVSPAYLSALEHAGFRKLAMDGRFHCGYRSSDISVVACLASKV